MKNTKFKKKSINIKLLEGCLDTFRFKYIVAYGVLVILRYIVEDLNLVKTTEYLGFVTGVITIMYLGNLLLIICLIIICSFEELSKKKKVEVKQNENK